MLTYLSLISLSLVIFCFISLFGYGMSILSNTKITAKNTKINKIVFITNFLLTKLLSYLDFNLSCIITKLYLNSENKT